MTVSALLLWSGGGLLAQSLDVPSTGGVGALHRLLSRLDTHRRLLVIGAHPDDEDTTLLTLVSRGMGGEAAYLSLSRGEGGQNLIGAELGQDLGLVRAQELVSARSVDGSRQYFTRAFDFGYTRSLDETLGFWGREELLEDAVRVVRRFRPQVVVSIFPPNARAGHGQHQAAGVTSQAVIEAAADVSRFTDVGPVWRVSSFYRAAFFRPLDSNLAMPSGGIDPSSGRSYFQIAMASRSMHRSQDMGVLQPIGPQESRVEWVSGERGANDIFDPFDSTLTGIATVLPEGALRDELSRILAGVGQATAEAVEALRPSDLSRVAAPLAQVHAGLLEARETVGQEELRPREKEAVLAFLDEKIVLASEAIAVCSGWVRDATTRSETLVPGTTEEITVDFYNAGPEAALVRPTIALTVDGGPRSELEERRVDSGALETWVHPLEVPPDAEPSVPYFLSSPRNGEMYDWSGADEMLRGEPFDRPVATVDYEVSAAGQDVVLAKEVAYRYRDQAVGEIRRPLRIVPALEIAVSPELTVWPLGSARETPVLVELRKNTEAAISGTLELEVPEGWPAVDDVPFEIGADETMIGVEIPVARPAAAGAGAVELRFAARVGEDVYRDSYPIVDYAHIRPVPSPRSAHTEVRLVDLELPRLDAVGYVRGASDRVPESLLGIGLPLELLASGDLADASDADLERFDAIVVGARAYEADPGLREINPRLLRYAENGGLLLVQYQQYRFSRMEASPGGGRGPFRGPREGHPTLAAHDLQIRRPHDRITDQTAPVEILDPAHPVFQHPHLIADDDWQGWVQERGLYFAGVWADEYQPLLRMTDPNMEPQEGGLLVAEHGEGVYVYTGLAFFRQLPAGVPGAYRLFLNLLALGEGARGGVH